MKRNREDNIKLRFACRRLSSAIDKNPNAFKGITIPLNVANNNSPFYKMSITGLLLAFFVKVFHS